jgi:mRNA interferase YafQ
VVPGTRFKRELGHQERRGKDPANLRAVIELLRRRLPLEPKHKNHALAGERRGYRDCHIEPDWLLIDTVKRGELILARTGTHSDLFRE